MHWLRFIPITRGYNVKILVLVKAVPHTSGGYDETQKKTELIPNPADMTALEEALVLREETGAQVTVMTMGIPGCESILRQTIACGADRAVLLTDRSFAGADTAATSRTIAAAVSHLGGFDLIFCGRKSTDGETGQVGPELATRLGIGCVTGCTEFRLAENGARCRCLSDRGTALYQGTLPLVVSFCNGINSPRLQSLSGLFRAKRAEIPVLAREKLGLAPESCGQTGSPTVVSASFRCRFEKRNPRRFTEETLTEAVAFALEAGKAVRHG